MKVPVCTKVTHCLPPNDTNSSRGGSKNRDFMEQKYWGQTWRQGTDAHLSTTEAQYVPQQIRSRDCRKKKIKYPGAL